MGMPISNSEWRIGTQTYTMSSRISFSLRFAFLMTVKRPIVALCVQFSAAAAKRCRSHACFTRRGGNHYSPT